MQQLANAETLEQVKNVLMLYWTQCYVQMTIVYHYLIAMNQLIQQFDGFKDPVFFRATFQEPKVEVSYRKVKTIDKQDCGSIAEEALVATEENLAKGLKLAEVDFKKVSKRMADLILQLLRK